MSFPDLVIDRDLMRNIYSLDVLPNIEIMLLWKEGLVITVLSRFRTSDENFAFSMASARKSIKVIAFWC